MTDTVKWVMCPKCDIVQPILSTWINYGGFEVVDCTWCEFENGAPYNFDRHSNRVDEPTTDEIKELLNKVKKCQKN